MNDIEKRARELIKAECPGIRDEAFEYGSMMTVVNIHAAVNALRAALKPQWQPIEFNEDGEPTNVPADTPILVPPTKRLGMTVAKWNPLDGWETETCSEWVGIYRPTHWQPLPAEPEVSP